MRWGSNAYKRLSAATRTMHFPPDLTLASSYIPACMCILKSGFAFALFVVSPVRGWIGICCLLTVDRLLWNNQSGGILDVNAVVGALVGGLMVVHNRGEGLHSMLQLAVVVVWMLVSACQIIGVARIPRGHEIVLAGGCLTILSCLYQAQERVELVALRAAVFVVLNVTLPYLGVLLQQPDIDTYVNLCRTLVLLLGEPSQALAWLAIYFLCIGYQLRGIGRPAVVQPEDDATLVRELRGVKRPEPSQEDEAVLREALSLRKGFASSAAV